MSLARIKKFGETFEISVDSDKALEYKSGSSTLREVLQADNIFTDISKGMVASDDELMKAFETTDVDKIADIILRKGEIQVTSEHRAAERERKRKMLVELIHQQAIDPVSGLPHPATRIAAALEQGKIHLDDNKSVEDQFDSIIKKLRPIIPLKIEVKKIIVTIPATYAGKAYGVVKSRVTVLREEWKNDGSLQVKVELPAGMYPDYLDKLNSVTHGEVVVEEST